MKIFINVNYIQFTITLPVSITTQHNFFSRYKTVTRKKNAESKKIVCFLIYQRVSKHWSHHSHPAHPSASLLTTTNVLLILRMSAESVVVAVVGTVAMVFVDTSRVAVAVAGIHAAVAAVAVVAGVRMRHATPGNKCIA